MNAPSQQRPPMHRMLGSMALAAQAVWFAPAAHAQAYPVKPISLVVSFAPGGSTDISARAVASELGKALGQTVVVENKVGAGGRVGTRHVAQAAPDGYTLLWGTGSSLSAAPVLYADQGYVATLLPVSLGATQPFVFTTNPATGAKNVAEFVALAKQRPGELNFASAGMGSSNHLLGEIFMASTGIRMTHVPYKGASAAMNAVMADEAQLMDEATSPILGALRSGQLVPLFVTSDVRDPMIPDVPTALEAGLPDMVITGYFGLLAPAGTPDEVVQKLNGAMKTALASPAIQQAFGNLGFTAAYSTPQQMADRISQVKSSYQRIVAERGIKVE